MTAIHVLIALVGIICAIGFVEALVDATVWHHKVCYHKVWHHKPTLAYRLFNALFAVILGGCLMILGALAWVNWR